MQQFISITNFSNEIHGGAFDATVSKVPKEITEERTIQKFAIYSFLVDFSRRVLFLFSWW
jgi:hypothetical protein